MTQIRLIRWVSCAALLVAPLSGRPDNWPGWRGPTGMGHTQEKGLPLTWGGTAQANVLWKPPLFPIGDKVLLDQNQSSPLAWGGRVSGTPPDPPAGSSQ